MKAITPKVYLTTDELDEEVSRREIMARLLEPGLEREQALAEINRLRSYADMKRLLALSKSVVVK